MVGLRKVLAYTILSLLVGGLFLVGYLLGGVQYLQYFIFVFGVAGVVFLLCWALSEITR
jgi:hypothetical protein